jgi:hypothetical protein
MLTKASRPTFQYRSLDGLIDEAADLLCDAALFRERYLAISKPWRGELRLDGAHVALSVWCVGW